MKRMILGLLSIFLISPLFASGANEVEYGSPGSPTSKGKSEQQVPNTMPDAIRNPGRGVDNDRF